MSLPVYTAKPAPVAHTAKPSPPVRTAKPSPVALTDKATVTTEAVAYLRLADAQRRQNNDEAYAITDGNNRRNRTADADAGGLRRIPQKHLSSVLSRSPKFNGRSDTTAAKAGTITERIVGITTEAATPSSANPQSPSTRSAYSPPARPRPISEVPTFDRVSLHAVSPLTWDSDEDEESIDDPLPQNITPADRFAAHITRQVIEALLGHRPVRQLQSWLAPGVYQSLSRRAGLGQQLCGTPAKTHLPRIIRADVYRPRSRAAEVSLVAHDGTRVRAVALRLELRRGHWHVTALEIA